MTLFENSVQTALYTTITCVLILLFILKVNPLKVVISFFKTLFTSKKFLISFVSLAFILIVNKYELKIENAMNYSLDFTSLIYSIEGDITYFIQSALENKYLTIVLAYFYVVVFQSILATSMGYYAYIANNKLLYGVCFAIALNYIIAIPFYLFFPVDEVWAYSDKVRFVMVDVFPNFEVVYRPLSGLDNCFPSLHTSISVTLAAIAWKSNSRVWRWFATISAAVIILSIFYLGIHWISDMIAGMILGLFASWFGLRIAGFLEKQKIGIGKV